MQETPASLLERLRQPRPQEAWSRFVDLYTPILYWWARRIGLQEQDAADLVQEVFLLLTRKLPSFTYDGQQSFRSWLWTVTMNKCREKWRGEGKVRFEAETAIHNAAAPDELGALEDEEYRKHLVQSALRVMQAEFPATAWKAFQQYVIAGRPADEVAKKQGISVGTVYAAKSRVLARLRQELDGLMSQ